MTHVVLNVLVVLAGLLICAGVYLEFGAGWSLIAGGVYLACNVISTNWVLNVRDSTPEI